MLCIFTCDYYHPLLPPAAAADLYLAETQETVCPPSTGAVCNAGLKVSIGETLFAVLIWYSGRFQALAMTSVANLTAESPDPAAPCLGPLALSLRRGRQRDGGQRLSDHSSRRRSHSR